MLLQALLALVPLVELEWDAPASCPSAAAFEERVRAQVDVQTQTESPAVLTATVVIRERGASQWELSLEMQRAGEAETRTFEGETCDAVVEVAATLVSLRVVEWVEADPLVPPPEPNSELEPELESEPELLAPETPDPVEPWSAEVVRAEPTQRSLQLGGWLALHGGLAFGVAPGVGGAVAIEGGLEARGWRVGLAVQTSPRRVRPHPEEPAVRGRFDLLTAEVLGCGVPQAGPVEFPVCGRFAAGGMRATGEGAVDRSEPAWGTWLGVGGSAAAVWRATRRVAPVISLEALAPLRGWSYSVGSVPGTLHQTGAVAFRAWVGVEIHL